MLSSLLSIASSLSLLIVFVRTHVLHGVLEIRVMQTQIPTRLTLEIDRAWLTGVPVAGVDIFQTPAPVAGVDIFKPRPRPR